MKAAPCWMGSILHVNLSTRQLTVEHPPAEFYRTYGGGSGLGLYYILRQMPPRVDPFSPENVLTFFAGPLTGLPVSGNARLSVNAKSPAAGAIGDSQVGGYFPAALKWAGFDGVVVSGAAEAPLYLHLHDGLAELRDASHLWGKTTAEVEALLKQELGDTRLEVLQCGPAGEKRVRYAALLTRANRACGRTGMGAVMGAKRLRAIVVQGSAKVTSANPGQLTDRAKWGAKFLPENPDVNSIAVYGSAGLVSAQQATGTLPAFNFNEGQFAGFERLTGEYLTDTILKKRDTCYACAVRCKRVVEAEYQGRKILPEYGGPEYETISALGTYCGVGDLTAISLGNQLCNAYGLDTISTGATIAFAMECFEHGLIDPADTGGVDLRFGNADAMLAMIELIARREGLGDLLAEGTCRAAAALGRNADAYLIAVKGTEAPAHMPQAKKTLGLIYAVNPFGADHQSHEHDPVYEEGTSELSRQRLAKLGLDQIQPPGSFDDEKVRFAYLTQLYYSALDTYNLCQYVFGPAWNIFAADETVELLQAATGWPVTVDEFLRVGERRLNMMRAFNRREGFDRAQDILPRKFFRPLAGTGPTAGVSLDEKQLEHHKDVYYALAGWDIGTGNPTPGKLAELGLGWIEL